jgi:hypothetical protein
MKFSSAVKTFQQFYSFLVVNIFVIALVSLIVASQSGIAAGSTTTAPTDASTGSSAATVPPTSGETSNETMANSTAGGGSAMTSAPAANEPTTAGQNSVVPAMMLTVFIPAFVVSAIAL